MTRQDTNPYLDEMNNEFKYLKNRIKNVNGPIYIKNTIESIKEFLVNSLTKDNKYEIVDKILLIDEFKRTLESMLHQYETLTEDVLKYIASIQLKITGDITLND